MLSSCSTILDCWYGCCWGVGLFVTIWGGGGAYCCCCCPLTPPIGCPLFRPSAQWSCTPSFLSFSFSLVFSCSFSSLCCSGNSNGYYMYQYACSTTFLSKHFFVILFIELWYKCFKIFSKLFLKLRN